MMKNIFALTMIVYILCMNTVHAQIPPSEVHKTIQTLFPDNQVHWIKPTDIKELWEVALDKGVIHVTGDGAFIFSGDIIDWKNNTNKTDLARQQIRTRLIDSELGSDVISFSPEKPDYSVVVFTDVDCQFCARMHAQIDQYMENGIEIRYAAFPRTGLKSSSYIKHVAVWCNKDQQQAMTHAKQGKKVTLTECKNPVERHFKLGRKIGVRGTPTIVFADGRRINQYISPDDMLLALKKGDK